MKSGYLLTLVLACSYFSYANVHLPRLFADYMVLQRNQPIPVWGRADAREKITVQLNNQQKTVSADKDGNWMVKLDAESAGGPFTLVVSGKNKITVSQVLVGEVWICSGQSNMEMPIAGWGKIDHYEQEIANADFPEIRQFKVPTTTAFVPQRDLSGGEWKPCTRETAGDFSAAAYFFAREIYNKLHVPIGLINTSWGGTMIETWISRGAFEKSDEFKTMITSMPVADMNVFAGRQKEMTMKKIDSLQGTFDPKANTSQWKEPAFDDTHWPAMKLPGNWEQQGMGLDNLDGVVWFRKAITISESDAGKAAIVDLGKIDDSDDSYLNGVRIGQTKNSYNEVRRYTIPAGVLKPGKNVLAIRVEDTGGGGGISGGDENLRLIIGEKVQPISGDWLFQIESVSTGNTAMGPNSYPTLLFNAMINPLIPYAFRGVIWYQGEANADRAYQYRKTFPLMITDWRSHWGAGEFPFLFVQLASWNAGNGDSQNGSTWAELREAQTMTLSLPNTGMAVTTDIGNATDIHPKNKQDVGKRLAAIALNKVYQSNTEYSGPVFQSMKKSGNKISLSFTHDSAGLMIKDKYGYLKGFEVAGSDHLFHYAKAYLEGGKVVVYNEHVADPVAVHYAWADDAGDANLFNKEGFPVLSFRTDQWQSITEKTKFAIHP